MILMLQKQLLMRRAKRSAVIVTFLFLIFTSRPAFAADDSATDVAGVNNVDIATTIDQTADTGSATTTTEEPLLVQTEEEVLPEAPTNTTEIVDEAPGACLPATQENIQPPAVNSESNVSNDIQVNNDLCSEAVTGDASVTDGSGNATSGDAEVSATIINQIQSLTGLSENQIATFIQDIYGDVYGDITIDPAVLANLLNQLCNDSCAPGQININNDLSLNNDISLSATSGNALVSGGDGNATSGNASVMLNLINIINSIITSGQSFVGTINIYGNLDGDILLPPDIINGLLSDTSSSSQAGSSSLAQTTNVAIDNNIVMNSASGDALVVGAGNATSGSSTNNLAIYNLVNSMTVGSRALLVFVNVLGQWTGFIVNSPLGTNAALLGGTSTGNGCTVCGAPTYADYTNNLSINNNIYLSATTGDATVSGNHALGDATSGNASTYLNLINIVNSNLVFSDWFGVLFINVFGSWNGSFGIDTVAGNTIPPLLNTSNNSTQKHHKHNSQPVFQFIPTSYVAEVLAATNNNDSGSDPISNLDIPSDPDLAPMAKSTYQLIFVLILLGLLTVWAAQQVYTAAAAGKTEQN